MNDSVDWSGGNDFIGNFLNAKKKIEMSTRMIPNNFVMSGKLYRQIKALFNDDDNPLKVDIEEYEE